MKRVLEERDLTGIGPAMGGIFENRFWEKLPVFYISAL